MRKISIIAATAAICLAIPCFGLAQTAKTKTLTGVVSKISGSQLTFSTTSAGIYSADIAGAQLLRKNGAPMNFNEFFVGDKIQVIGTVWNDNSISASSIRDMTLYAHTGSFSGKITGISPSDFSFTVQSSQPAVRIVKTDSLTAFKKNSGSASFQDLQLGMSVTVKGLWERSNSPISAKEVNANFRLINISFSGELTMRNGSAITITTPDNIIYGVDTGSASFISKNSKPMNLSEFRLGDTVKVWGKHISGGVQVIASKLKDNWITK